MTREWQPGDVAKSVDHGYIGILVDGCWNTLHDTGQHWHNSEGGWDRADHPRRPLVVIDPEDREQIERLAHLLVTKGATLNDRGVAHNGLAVALREFADPSSPRPDEPQGLGAVVEDDDGDLWVRLETGAWAYGGNAGGCVMWPELSVARVLSPGYDPEATT